jgi:hypothetical protein
MANLPEFRISGSQTSKICGVKGLGETGRGYVIDWIKSHLYGFKREFSNKFTEKGTRLEDTSIELVAKVYDLGFLVKNTERKFNAFAEGEADIVTKPRLHDVKNCWDAYTFPLFDKECTNAAYLWQADTYMWLWDKDEYWLHYTLNDAPDDMIAEAYWKQHKYVAKLEGEEVNEDLYEEVRSKMIYSHLPDHLRVKTFKLKRDEARIKIIEKRVIECRELITNLKNN